MPLPSWPFAINSNSPQANGLVSWWPWLASRGAVWRDLKGIVNLAPTGSPTQRPADTMGWCTSLVGTSSQRWTGTSTQLDAVIAGNQQWTAVVWVRQASATSNKWLLSKYNLSTFRGIDFRVDPSNLYLQITDTGGTVRQPVLPWTLATGAWTLVSCGMRANQQVFIKANTKASVVADLSSYTFAANTDAFTVGGVTNFFTGDVAEVRIYNRGLSDAELNAMYIPETRWDLYRQPRRYYYAPHVAAAAAFNPVWARRANTLLGGGSS